MADIYEDFGYKPKKVGKESDIYQDFGYEPTKKHSKPQEESFLHKLPRNINIGGAEMGNHLLKFLHLPHKNDEEIAKFFGQHNEPTSADKILQGLSQYAPALAAPETSVPRLSGALSQIPKVGGFLKSALGNALSQGIFSSTQNEGERLKSGGEAAATSLPYSAITSAISAQSPLLRSLGKIASGGLGAYVGNKVGGTTGALIGGGLGLTGVNPQLKANRTLLKGVAGSGYQEKLDAAERLGLSYLTPAEASGNPFVGAQQGAIGKTEKGAQLLYDKGEQRISSEKKAIDKMLDTVYHSETLDPYTKDLYKQSYVKELPHEVYEKFKEDEVIKRAIRMVENKPAYKESLKEVPKNSVAYWDHVKQAMDDMIESAPKKEAKIIKASKDKVLSNLDSIAPEYNQARQLAERQINRRKIEDKLNQSQYRGTDFYNKILKNDKLYNALLYSFRNVPDAQSQLRDMRLVFKDLINPPTVRTAAGLAKTSMTNERSGPQVIINKLKEAMSLGKYDKAAVELVTNPKWKDELHKINTLSGYEKRLKAAVSLLGKANSQYAGGSQKPMELELTKSQGK